MNKIEIEILNPEALQEAEKMMVAMARLTQRGHTINNMNDLHDLLSKSYLPSTVKTMSSLPHPTIQKFGLINVAIVGASRRFLAQITRHQNEVKFMSASLQYSDYTDKANFVVPYEILEYDALNNTDYANAYEMACDDSMEHYKHFAKLTDNDAAGYIAPQGLRNVLIISASPYQLKHIINQRSCNRNTKETQYVMLKLCEELQKRCTLFDDCGPSCLHDVCKEGKMACDNPLLLYDSITHILDEQFKIIRR